VNWSSLRRTKKALDRGSQCESTANNSKLYVFPFQSKSINRNEINREKLGLPRLCGGARFALVRIEVLRGYQSERIFAVASCPAPQGLPPSNQTSTPEMPLVPNESASFLARRGRGRRTEKEALCGLSSHSFRGFSEAKEVILRYVSSRSLLPGYRRQRYIFEQYFTC